MTKLKSHHYSLNLKLIIQNLTNLTNWIKTMSISNFRQIYFSYNVSIIIRLIAISIILYIALVTSWISDDAQITFRQILNFISGDGISFQYGDRVQAFTHPLWFLLLSGIFAVTRELFVTTSILSICYQSLQS